MAALITDNGLLGSCVRFVGSVTVVLRIQRTVTVVDVAHKGLGTFPGVKYVISIFLLQNPQLDFR
jgi:hypothetical protein